MKRKLVHNQLIPPITYSLSTLFEQHSISITSTGFRGLESSLIWRFTGVATPSLYDELSGTWSSIWTRFTLDKTQFNLWLSTAVAAFEDEASYSKVNGIRRTLYTWPNSPESQKSIRVSIFSFFHHLFRSTSYSLCHSLHFPNHRCFHTKPG